MSLLQDDFEASYKGELEASYKGEVTCVYVEPFYTNRTIWISKDLRRIFVGLQEEFQESA